MRAGTREAAALLALALWSGRAAADVDPRVLESAQAALAKDPARAQQILEQAYRSSRDPQLFLHLGRAALAAGRKAGAADLFRRYLDSLGERTDEAAQREVAAHLNSLGATLGEVLVTAEGGGLLLVDGHLVGALPLPGPVLVEAGPHRFRVEVGPKRYETDELTVPAGRQADLRLSPGARGTAVAVLTLSPVVLLRILGSAERLLTPAVQRAALEAAQREHAVLYPREKTAALFAPRPAACPDEPVCLSEAAAEAQARALLSLRVQQEGGRSVLAAEMVDVPSGDVSATESAPLPGDDPGRAAAVGALVKKVLASGLLRKRGTLAIGSLPSGATVIVDERVRGTTPLERAALAGRHAIRLELAGHAPYRTEVEVGAGQTASVQGQLVPSGTPTGPLATGPSAPTGRPAWRLATGGVLLGAGALLAGFGISALSVNGGCADVVAPLPDAECDYFYGTRAVGGSLLGVGVAAAVGGAVLLALPGPKPRRVTSPTGPAGP